MERCSLRKKEVSKAYKGEIIGMSERVVHKVPPDIKRMSLK